MFKQFFVNFFDNSSNLKLNFLLSILAFLIFASSGQIFGPYLFFGLGKWFSLVFLLIYLILPAFHFQKLSRKVLDLDNKFPQKPQIFEQNPLIKYQNLIQFWLISIVFFLYFGRMSGFGLDFFGWNFSSFWLFLPFLLFTFSVNYFLFKSRKIPDFLLTIFVFIVSLLNFSFVDFLQNDRTNKRFFIDNALDFIFNLPIWTWFLVSILIIFISTLINFEAKLKLKRPLLILPIIAISFILTYNLSFLYWYKSLIFVIIWHFLFQFVNSPNPQDKTHKNNFLIFGYHFFLLIIVFFFGFSIG